MRHSRRRLVGKFLHTHSRLTSCYILHQLSKLNIHSKNVAQTTFKLFIFGQRSKNVDATCLTCKIQTKYQRILLLSPKATLSKTQNKIIKYADHFQTNLYSKNEPNCKHLEQSLFFHLPFIFTFYITNISHHFRNVTSSGVLRQSCLRCD